MEKEHIDLLELQQRLKTGVELLFPNRIWVKAEVSAMKARNGGHCYLELSQSDKNGLVAKVNAIIWSSRYRFIAPYFESVTGSPLQEGMVILVEIQVNYSELYGLSLIINDIDPELNPYFRFAEAKFWIACQNGQTIGRIGAIIHHAYIEKTQEKLGRITRCEFIDDAAVVDALFATAENWCRQQGMTGVMGPLGFSNLDQQAVLVEGFDRLASVASVYHHEYYHARF